MWRVEGYKAHLALPALSASIDLFNPAQGLANLTLSGAPIEGQVLQVALPSRAAEAVPPIEHYTRGGDLVATYSENGAWPFRAQLYWRTASHRGERATAAVELVASVQTHLLDSRAALGTHSEVAAREVFRLCGAPRARFEPVVAREANRLEPSAAPACFLFRLNESLSYAEMVHPVDFQGATISLAARAPRDLQVRLSHELFVSPLEKGVILRARVLALFLARDDDMRVAAEHYAIFSAAEPPLTT
jgi:hypothetical protein